jgi:hypothetical protein
MINLRYILLFLSLSLLILILGYIFYVNTSNIIEVLIEPSIWKSIEDSSNIIPSIKITIIKK